MTRRSALRGFTLVELLVALTGGLFVSLAVFALARDASRFYQREGRMANATLAGLVGFERLRADIARAGYLITPNVAADPRLCNNRPTTPARLMNLAALRVEDGASPGSATLEDNGLAPDRLHLAGSYGSADEYPTRRISRSGAGVLVRLQTDVGPLARLGWFTTAPADRTRIIRNLFAPGRALRIANEQGKHQYGLIQDATADAGGPLITLAAAPALTLGADAGVADCKIAGNGGGELVAVVNFIQYDVRNLSSDSNFGGANASYAELYKASSDDGKVAHENDRTELVRVEVDAAGMPLTLGEILSDNSVRQTKMEELVAEYAVDFQIEVSAVGAPGVGEPTVTQVAAANLSTFAGVVTQGAQPQRIRTVRARLSVRSREPDREVQLPAAFAGSLYRVGLGTGGSAPFARVRTFQTDIMLNNLTSIRW